MPDRVLDRVSVDRRVGQSPDGDQRGGRVGGRDPSKRWDRRRSRRVGRIKDGGGNGGEPAHGLPSLSSSERLSVGVDLGRAGRSLMRVRRAVLGGKPRQKVLLNQVPVARAWRSADGSA